MLREGENIINNKEFCLIVLHLCGGGPPQNRHNNVLTLSVVMSV